MDEHPAPETPVHPQSPTVAHADDHKDHSHDAEHVSKHVKAYVFVGGVLLVCTGITVWLSYVDFGSQNRNIIIAMIVATFKAGLVAAIFMHLKEEKITIWRFLIFTAIFVFGLFMLTLLHHVDPIMGTTYSKHL